MVSQSAMVITKFSFEHFFSFYQRMISTLPLKNLQKKVRKCHSLRLKTFLFDLQVVSKPFTKTFEKAEKRQFQRFRTFVFQLKIASKPFSKKLSEMLSIIMFDFCRFNRFFPLFQKTVSTLFLKKLQISERCHFLTIRAFVLTSR